MDSLAADHEPVSIENELGASGLTRVGSWTFNIYDSHGRVKQVIGKSLEGGVLRREDEYKYVKILPTIQDPPDVAKAKIHPVQIYESL